MKQVKDTLPNGIIGSIAEHLSIAYLMDLGYEVHSATCGNSLADLVAITPEGQVRLFDVKKATTDTSSLAIRIHKQVGRPEDFERVGVEFLFVWFDLSKGHIVVEDTEESFYDKVESLGYETARSRKLARSL